MNTMLTHLEAIGSTDDQPEARAAALLQRVQGWNATCTDYPRDKTVAQLFEEIAAAHPDAIAVVLEGQRVTYADLNARANRLAHRLREIGVGPEVMVACCLERSIELIVAIIAVLKAGGAYVPLDPAYPEERLTFFLQDTQAPVILTQKSLASRGAARGGATCILVDDEACVGGSDRNPTAAGGPNSLAYVMYTSGSTGRPKGVMVENRSIVRLVRNTNFCRFGPDEVFLQFAPISFDASTLELWGPLLNGGRLVVMPPCRASLEDLGRTIVEHNVTVLWLTAGLFNVMVDDRLDDLKPVRQLLAGGDVVSPRHARLVLERQPQCRLINGYGPTENTTFTCCHTMDSPEDVTDPIPIGLPISNTQVYILDERMRPVPPGVVGELYAAGDGLARGYLNNPDATNARFLPNPFGIEPGARMYETGDLARWRPDGVVEFLGRVDSQVKILGHRIEPGEIEAVLGTHEQVIQNCVVAHVDESGSKRLVAYFVPSERTPTSAALRAHLAAKLPHYMIPSLFSAVPSLPLTPNGKIDRASLPVPKFALSVEPAAPGAGTDLEQTVMDAWCKYLGTAAVGPDDNFFDCGGDSLMLARLHAALQAVLRVQFPITAMFEFTTVRSLAGYLDGRVGEAPLSDARQRAQRQRDAFARRRERRIGGV